MRLPAVTGVLAFLTWRVNGHSEQRLLIRQLAQVGTLLSTWAAVRQVQLADIAQAAVSTDASPDAFARWAARQLQQTGQSLSLWRVTDGRCRRSPSRGAAGCSWSARSPTGGGRRHRGSEQKTGWFELTPHPVG